MSLSPSSIVKKTPNLQPPLGGCKFGFFCPSFCFVFFCLIFSFFSASIQKLPTNWGVRLVIRSARKQPSKSNQNGRHFVFQPQTLSPLEERAPTEHLARGRLELIFGRVFVVFSQSWQEATENRPKVDSHLTLPKISTYVYPKKGEGLMAAQKFQQMVCCSTAHYTSVLSF